MSFNKVDYEATKNIPIPLGVGQTWQNVAASRVKGTTYTNTTGRPIEVSIGLQGTNNAETATFTVNGVTIYSGDPGIGGTPTSISITATIPNGSTYNLTSATATIIQWSELR